MYSFKSVKRDNKPFWIVVDGNGIPEVYSSKFIIHLARLNRSRHTLKRYATSLMIFFNYLEVNNMNVLDVANIKEIRSFFSKYSDYLSNVRNVENITCNERCSDVVSFYSFLADEEIVSLNSFTLINESSNSVFNEFIGKKHHKEKFKFNIDYKTERAKPNNPIDRTVIEKLIIYLINKVPYLSEGITSKMGIKELTMLRRIVFLELAINCGLRVGEILGLRLDDLSDIGLGNIEILHREDNENEALSKTQDRILSVDEEVANHIITLLTVSQNHFPSDYLFVSYSGKNVGKALTDNAIKSEFNIYQKILLEQGWIDEDYKIHPHDLRHAFATDFYDSTQDQISLQTILGHKRLASSDRYIHARKAQKLMVERANELKLNKIKEED